MGLQGCTQKTKVSEANNLLIINSELIKLKTYRELIISIKDDLTNYPSGIYSPNMLKPEPMLDNLDTFLNENNCMKTLLLESCYTRTVSKLIDTTEIAESKEFELYMLNRYTTRLLNAIDKIIDNFPEVKQ